MSEPMQPAAPAPAPMSGWKKHDRPVHAFVAWMAVLNAALVAWAPVAMYAMSDAGEPSYREPAAVVSGVDICIQHCASAKAACYVHQGAQDQAADACVAAAEACYAGCKLTAEAPSEPGVAAPTMSQMRYAKEMKGRIAEFDRNLNRLNLRLSRYEKVGREIPADLAPAMAEGKSLVAGVRAAAGYDDLAKLGDVKADIERINGTIRADLAVMMAK